MMTEEEEKIYRKIEAGKKYRVFRNDVGENAYYRISISQTKVDGSKERFYEKVTFKKGVVLDNQTDIIIKKAYENVMANTKDEYNPIFYLFITDFDIVERQEQIEQQALREFNNKMDESDDLPF